jgi:hypothetical protein
MKLAQVHSKNSEYHRLCDCAGVFGSIPSLDDNQCMLVLCIRILCRGLSAGYLAEHSPAIVQLLQDSLEYSDCITYLSEIARHVAQWISSSTSPLTPREFTAIMNAMIDTDRLPEVAAQPYLIRVVDLLLASSCLPQTGQNAWTQRCTALTRCQSIGLMCVHDGLRRKCLARLLESHNDSVCERLEALLAIDMQPVAARYWLVSATPQLCVHA